MEILSTERVTDQPWLNLFVRTYRHNGKDMNWIFSSRRLDPPFPSTGYDGVVIVPITQEAEPRLIMIREFRVPLGDHEVGFPAGITNPGEDLDTTIRRELLEETGYELIETLKVSPVTYSSSGISDEAVVIAFVHVHPIPVAKPTLEETEEIDVLAVNLAEMRDLMNGPSRFNGRVWPILFLFDQLGGFALKT